MSFRITPAASYYLLSTEYCDSSGLGTLYEYSHVNTASSGATERQGKKIKIRSPKEDHFFPLHFPIKSFGLNGPFAALLSTVDCPPPSRGAGMLASGSFSIDNYTPEY